MFIAPEHLVAVRPENQRALKPTLAALAANNPGTAILATSPGGIAEMSLTARNLHLGVPIVTAFHVSRMVAVVLLIGPLYRLSMRISRKRP